MTMKQEKKDYFNKTTNILRIVLNLLIICLIVGSISLHERKSKENLGVAIPLLFLGFVFFAYVIIKIYKMLEQVKNWQKTKTKKISKSWVEKIFESSKFDKYLLIIPFLFLLTAIGWIFFNRIFKKNEENKVEMGLAIGFLTLNFLGILFFGLYAYKSTDQIYVRMNAESMKKVNKWVKYITIGLIVINLAYLLYYLFFSIKEMDKTPDKSNENILFMILVPIITFLLFILYMNSELPKYFVLMILISLSLFLVLILTIISSFFMSDKKESQKINYAVILSILLIFLFNHILEYSKLKDDVYQKPLKKLRETFSRTTQVLTPKSKSIISDAPPYRYSNIKSESQ